MIYILVRLSIKDFAALEKFERKAAIVMGDYQGKIISAFETERKADNSGEEIHLLEFPSEQRFTQYRQDERIHQLQDLRIQAIADTEVTVSTKLKSYT